MNYQLKSEKRLSPFLNCPDKLSPIVYLEGLETLSLFYTKQQLENYIESLLLMENISNYMFFKK